MLAASKLNSALNEVKNIYTGGQEVERSILDYLRRSFVDSYPIHQGHVIDRSSRISPQIDVVITGHNSLPLFCSTLDGTTIVMREAVLALGEIKSSYYKAGLANKFTNSCGAVTEMDKGEGKRDLFSFMILVESGRCAIKDEIEDIAEIAYMPRIFCYLDKGVVVPVSGEVMVGEEISSRSKLCISNPQMSYAMALLVPKECDNMWGLNLQFLYMNLARFLTHNDKGGVNFDYWIDEALAKHPFLVDQVYQYASKKEISERTVKEGEG